MMAKYFSFILLCCFMALILVGYISTKSSKTNYINYKREIDKRDSIIFKYNHLLDSANINH